MLQSESAMGEKWMELVTVWASFEAWLKFREIKKLAPINCPPAVGDWIGRAHLSMWRPIIEDSQQYEALFWEWWSHIQPEWQFEDGKLAPGSLMGDWDVLWLPGTNGIVSVMVALFYWGLEILDDNGGCKSWLSAVEECCANFKKL